MDLIWNDVLRAGFYLFVSGIVWTAWKTAYDAAKKGDPRKVLRKGLMICAGISAFAGLTLGSHLENCDDDPLFGYCDRVQDFAPTWTQRAGSFSYFMTLLSVPVAIGVFGGKRDKS